MIDWLTVVIPFRHKPLSAGFVQSFNENGEIQWSIQKKFVYRPSHSSTIVLKSQNLDSDGWATELFVDCNPIKHLQHHNAFGTNCIASIMTAFFRSIAHQLKMPYTPFDILRVWMGGYEVKRIDITAMYDLGTDINVDHVLNSLSSSAGTKFKNVWNDKGSIYFNKGSGRWSFVFYNKFREIRRRDKENRLSLEFEQNDMLKKYTEGKLRAELRIHSRELKDHGINSGSDLTQHKLIELYNIYMGRCDLSFNIRLSDRVEKDLPPQYRGTYLLWKAGENIRSTMSRASFYRHKSFFKTLGINLDDQQKMPGSNVVPFFRVLECEPVEVPTELIKNGLIFSLAG